MANFRKGGAMEKVYGGLVERMRIFMKDNI